MAELRESSDVGTTGFGFAREHHREYHTQEENRGQAESAERTTIHIAGAGSAGTSTGFVWRTRVRGDVSVGAEPYWIWPFTGLKPLDARKLARMLPGMVESRCSLRGLKIDGKILVIDRRAISPRRLFEIVVVLVAATAAFVPTSPRIIERWFATGVYPHVQRVLTSASNVLPIPWLDLLSTGALLWLAWTWWLALRPGDERRLTRVATASRRTLVSAACVYLAFLLLWGFNYRRLPMASRLEISASPPSTEEVLGLGLVATERANPLPARAH